MKYSILTIKKVSVFSFVLLVGVVTSCQKDEELNLIEYPENPISVSSDEGVNVNIIATYDGEGNIQFSNSLQKTWRVSLDTPSPKDASIGVSPVLVNIPEDKITLSADKLTIPAGFAFGDITLGIKDDDVSFIQDNLDAQTYELGLSVVEAEGLNLNIESSMGKLIIEKEKYKANISIAGEEGNSVQMKRVYRNGEVLGDPISYSFKLQLDKPAKENLTVNFVSDGIPDEFKNSSVFTPASIVIPEGAKESDEITWTISNEFLKTTEEDETFDINLKAELSECKYAELNSDNANIQIQLIKTSSVLELVYGTDSDWLSIDRANWNVTLGNNWSGNLDACIDNNFYTYNQFIEIDSSIGEIVFDLQQNEKLSGLRAQFGYEYSYPNYKYFAPIKTEILVSSDNQEWNSLGILDTEQAQLHYIKFVIPSETRYLKYRATVNSDLAMIRLIDLQLYKTE